VLLIGSDAPEVAVIAAALPADLLPLPSELAEEGASTGWPWAEELEAWRTAALPEPAVEAVVVAAWTTTPNAPALLAEVGLDAWVARGEAPLARWFAALGVASRRCADGGAVVAVIEQPAPLDCAGRAAEAGVADAVEAMVRSLARSEGGRGVRVNAVTTPIRLVTGPVADPPASLATFPGTIEGEVVGAVRMLLSGDAAGVTGTVVHADCGRSWR
jgi:NAD(P)-dependent dehydrogenase (short-subunit alcohol dehydrogenase family)